MRNSGKNHFHPYNLIFNDKPHRIIHLKFLSLLAFFFILTMFLINFLSADTISQNAGGKQATGTEDRTAVTADRYIEGIFFQTPEAAAEEEEPPVTPPSGGGGGAPSVNINVSPGEFNINLAVNTTSEKRTIQVRNLGASQVVVSVTQSNLNNRIILSQEGFNDTILGTASLTIPVGQTIELGVEFRALDETGIFTGTINIGGKTVLVSLNVRTQLLLFDSNIVVLNDDFQVPQGEELRTLVTLIPLGDEERLDVTLNFLIKDYRNQVYLTKSETLLVDSQVQLFREFDTGALPLGDYVIGLELVYPNGVAPSSAHFEVITKISVAGRTVLYLIGLILFALIIVLAILIWRRLKKKREESNPVLGTRFK